MSTLETPRAGYCEDDIPLDDEELNYILSNHAIQIRAGGEACYLLKPLTSGSLENRTTITSWDSTDPYTKVLWQLESGRVYNVNPNTGHPDLRTQTTESWGSGGLAVWVDGTLATRVSSTSQIELDTDYCVSEADDRSVSLVFRSGWDASAHTIEYQYRTLCACADWRQGSSTGQKRCTTCYGRGFEGGYNQWTHAAAPKWHLPVNAFLVRIPQSALDIKIVEQGLVANKELKAWCLPPPDAPDVDDFDILVRSASDDPGEEGLRYEILNEQDSRIGGYQRSTNILLHQSFSLKLLEETDVRNQITVSTS